MIITVTLNPALDKTARIDALQIGELNRLEDMVIDVAGKGISVARMVSVLGEVPLATGFIGEGNGEYILHTLDKLKIPSDFIRVKGDNRTNLKVIDRNGCLTEINEPGITVTESDGLKLFEQLAKKATSNGIFVLSGSRCQGVDTEIYARMIRMIHQHGGKAFLDVDGEAFEAALLEKPDFIKPNRHELLEYFKVKGDLSLLELKELCHQLLQKGVPQIALSMGAEGAMFLREDKCVYGKGLKVVCRSPVGAGDSIVAAFAYGTKRKFSWKEMARLAIAASAGAVTTEGTKPPSRQVIEALLLQVELKDL